MGFSFCGDYFGENINFPTVSTNGNCLPPMGGSGSAKPQSAQAPLCGFFRHILRLLVLLRKPLFATAKRQLPRTLDDIWAKLLKLISTKNHEIYLDNI